MENQLISEEMISAEIEKHADMVRRICFLHIRNNSDVDDIFQEVFLKFFQNYYQLKDEDHRKAWLCRVTINKCRDLNKSFWKRKVSSIEAIEGVDLVYESPEQSDLVEAVLKLPDVYKDLIYLHYYEGRTVPEIAVILQQNPNTVYTQIRRARNILKKRLGRD